MRKTRFLTLAASVTALALVVFLVVPGSEGEPVCADLVPTAPRQADLACVGRWIETEQSWPSGTREQATHALAALSGEAADLDDLELYVRLAALVALPDNGHTSLAVSPVYSQFGLVPLRTYWFDEGLFVSRATQEHRRLLGARVLEIAGQTPEALMATMQRYFGGPDEDFRVYGHEWFLSPALLAATGVSPSPDATAWRLELTSGETVTLELPPYVSDERHPGGYPWRQLHPAPLPREGDGWVSWLGEAGTEIPWAFDEPDRVFRYRFLAEASTAHIQLRSNISSGGEDIADFQRSLKRHFKTDKPRFIVWDQRWNGGGDLTRTADFSRKLHEHLPPDGRVFVLTSNATFSAGIYTAFFPEWTNDERTTVVGTRVGDRERFWAETGPPIVLPETGWRIYYSLQLHDLADGCDESEPCHIRRDKWNMAVGSFDPEHRIGESSVELVAGRDTALDWVLAEIGRQPPSP